MWCILPVSVLYCDPMVLGYEILYPGQPKHHIHPVEVSFSRMPVDPVKILMWSLGAAENLLGPYAGVSDNRDPDLDQKQVRSQ